MEALQKYLEGDEVCGDFCISPPNMLCHTYYVSVLWDDPRQKYIRGRGQSQLGTSHRTCLCETAGAMYVVWSRETFWLRLGRDRMVIADMVIAQAS